MGNARTTSSTQSGLFDVAMAVQNVLKVFGAKLQIHIPVVVTKDYDADTDMVEVQPIMTKAFNENSNTVYEEWTPFNVHVAHFGIEGMLFVFPVKKGMTGWVMSSDRDVFKSRKENSGILLSDNAGPSDPSSFDMGKYTQGIFVPDRWFPEKSQYGIGYDAVDGNQQDGHKDDIGLRMIDADGTKGGIFLSKSGVLFVEKNEKKIRIDLSSEKAISINTKIGQSEVKIDMDSSANVTMSNDGALTVISGAKNENPLRVKASKEDNLVSVETQSKKTEINFSGESIKAKASIGDREATVDIDSSANVKVSNDGDLNLTCGAKNETPLNVSISKSGNVVSMETAGKKAAIDFNIIPEGESIGIQEAWFPTAFGDHVVHYGRYRVMMGSQQISSTSVVDDIGEI